MLAPRPTHESSAYRIVELIGRGGSASVYRARREGSPDGAEVAIKVLADAQPPDRVLTRFQQEARIQGLLRDPAVVAVQPARRFGGRWAVVMELVPGASCHELVRRHGALPARVAVQVIQQVATALDRLFHARGPDGTPIQLVHRDLKPGNIQLTQHGACRILDFGVAQARFSEREPTTPHAVQGTYGYIAPERLLGLDTPAADVFSLGMVLFKLITAGPTDRRYLYELADTCRGAEGHALRLAADMCREEHHERPSPQQVAQQCAELAARMEGPTLQAWCAQHVPAGMGTTDDPLCGTVMTPGDAAASPGTRAATGRRQWRRALALGRSAYPVAVALVVLLVAGAVTLALASHWMQAEVAAPVPIGLSPSTGGPPRSP